MKLFIVFGDQLFPLEYYDKYKDHHFLMIESHDLCTHFKYHKIRLIFLMSAMRHKKEEFSAKKWDITHYELEKFNSTKSYSERLQYFCDEHGVKEIRCFEKEDKFFKNNLLNFAEKNNIHLTLLRSPLFLNTHEDFKDYLGRHKKPFMKVFYEESRKRFRLLVDENQKPLGGKWSFDEDNRSKLKKGVFIPQLPITAHSEITNGSIATIERNFKDHPGMDMIKHSEYFIFPVTRVDALKWLDNFLVERLSGFGVYEDAISSQHDFLFHSLLSPLMNSGLLTPKEVIEKTLKYAQKVKPPLNSLEGFIRQIVGWREFVRGIYHNFSEIQEKKNFFQHKRKLKPCWYDGTTGIEPLDDSLKKVIKFGYAHHIERLMIFSNIMLLCEVNPSEVHAWFNEMFVDSMDWVMGPNVYGMAQFADGGIFATKPYICGSNYLIKMSDYKKGQWSDEMDALYWSFIGTNSDFFSKQYRLSMMAKTWEKMDAKKKSHHLKLSSLVKDRLTYEI